MNTRQETWQEKVHEFEEEARKQYRYAERTWEERFAFDFGLHEGQCITYKIMTFEHEQRPEAEKEEV